MRTFAMLFLWISGIGVVFWAGSQQDPQIYPWEGVLFFGVVATVETILLGLILRPRNYHRSWGRALAAALIFAAVALFWAMGSLQQPRYYVMHVYWLVSVVLTALTLLVFTWTAINRRAQREPVSRRREVRYYMY